MHKEKKTVACLSCFSSENFIPSMILKAQEDERKRISRELHDSITQELVSSLMSMRVMKYMEDLQEMGKKISQVEQSLATVLKQLKSTSVELRPSLLEEQGIDVALRSHFGWMENQYKLAIFYTSNIGIKRFTKEIETVIYRICQEALLNVAKYAGTKKAYVHFQHDHKELRLKIADYGKGFNENFLDIKGTGLGLIGMKERAKLVNGQLLIHSSIGKGTVVKLSVPL